MTAGLLKMLSTQLRYVFCGTLAVVARATPDYIMSIVIMVIMVLYPVSQSVYICQYSCIYCQSCPVSEIIIFLRYRVNLACGLAIWHWHSLFLSLSNNGTVWRNIVYCDCLKSQLLYLRKWSSWAINSYNSYGCLKSCISNIAGTIYILITFGMAVSTL